MTTATSSTLAPAPCSLFVPAPRPPKAVPTSYEWVPPAPIAALPLIKPMTTASTPAPLPCVSFVMLCPKIAVIWCCGY
ncbi:hypothetical protein PR003_g35218 [Phytophthora rubi]|uniref:Uncharacterized protein n=1 Tax=Phytophthora rubi TaxID=129364 RepID=A0A6A4ADG1_9STRA|nr:hypothetical protein PR003_g35218 [Phytophthora rubi]